MTKAMTGKNLLPALPEKRQIQSLTGLRIFAAMWVVLFHFREVSPDQTWEYPLVDWLFRYGGHGVTLFFVLSGFILSHVYVETFKTKVTVPAFWSFMLFRFARLYPVHLVTLLIMVALFAAERALGSGEGTDSRFSPIAILTTLTMTQAWIPGVETPNSPAWSISAEWFAYLLFPFLCLFSARVWRPTLLLGATGVALAVVYDHLVETHLVHISACFIVGMAANRIAARASKRIPKWLGAAAVMAILVIQALPFETPIVIQLVVFATLIVALGAGDDFLCMSLGKPLMLYLGELSYAIYMFHWIARVIVRVGAEKLGVIDDLHPAALVGAYLLFTIGGSMILFQFVEKPGRRLIRSLEGRVRALALR